MNKAKHWSGRIFLNPYDKSCTAVMTWAVDYYPGKMQVGSAKRDYKPSVECFLSANDGLNLYLSKPRIFSRVLTNLRAELNKFEQAKEEAYVLLEEWNNAQS